MAIKYDKEERVLPCGVCEVPVLIIALTRNHNIRVTMESPTGTIVQRTYLDDVRTDLGAETMSRVAS